jgi:hypothetical protein
MIGKRWKRGVLALLAVVLVGGLLSACEPPPDPGFFTPKKIVYYQGAQRVLLIENHQVVADVPVSGRLNLPRPGVYAVMNKKHPGSSGNLRLPHFTGFTWGPSSDIGFHGIPLRPDGSPIQSDAELGIPLSAGCVRMNQFWAQVIYDWYPIGTRVEVWP